MRSRPASSIFIRNSLLLRNWKDENQLAAELKKIYNAETAELAAKRLEDLSKGPLEKDPVIVQCWRRVWDQGRPLFRLPRTKSKNDLHHERLIESLHMQLRKVLKTRGHFQSDEAATKLIYLVLRDITKMDESFDYWKWW